MSNRPAIIDEMIKDDTILGLPSEAIAYIEQLEARIAQLESNAAGKTVVLVHQLDNEGNERHAIFSSVERADEWMNKHPKFSHVCVSPYVVDVPEYGNELETEKKQ